MFAWTGTRGLITGRPPLGVGLVAASAAVASATALIYPLEQIAPAVALSVVYLPGILLVSALCGLALGLLTSVASALAFNFFHIPPIDRFTIADSRNWVALAAFTLVAIVVSTIADLARNRAAEAERGRAEADLAAGLARELLAGARTDDALVGAAQRIGDVLGIGPVELVLGTPAAVEGARTLALGFPPIATLVVPRDAPVEVMARLQRRVAPALEALVAIALHRDAVQAEAVETAALRRSDELKTALLRAVSHDLRSPLTAIVTAGHALGARSLTELERAELSAAVVDEGQRLSGLIDKLLDLSRLQSGRAEPRRDWISLEEVLIVARDALAPADAAVTIAVAANVPPLRADAAQLQQVFVNLLENARRYGSGRPVTVTARRAGPRVIVRVVDQGPGVSPDDRERIFEPFYRGSNTVSGPRWPGSGLGLAIARGFVEAGGGRISVDSLPGQGSAFVVELPLDEPATAPASTLS